MGIVIEGKEADTEERDQLNYHKEALLINF
jgi:hypothetical protein